MTTRDKEIMRLAGIACANSMKAHLDVWGEKNKEYHAILGDFDKEFTELCNQFIKEEGKSGKEPMYLITVLKKGKTTYRLHKDWHSAYESAAKLVSDSVIPICQQMEYDKRASARLDGNVDYDGRKFSYSVTATYSEEDVYDDDYCVFSVEISEVKVEE